MNRTVCFHSSLDFLMFLLCSWNPSFFVEPPVTIVRKMEDQKFPDGTLISLECELSRHNVDVKWLKVSTWFCCLLLLLLCSINNFDVYFQEIPFKFLPLIHISGRCWSKAKQGAAHLRHGPKTFSSAHEVSSQGFWHLHLWCWRSGYFMQCGCLW